MKAFAKLGRTPGFLLRPRFTVTGAGMAPFDVPGATGSFPTDVYEAGQIVGEYVDGGGVHRGFVASPILFGDGFESGDLSAWSASVP